MIEDRCIDPRLVPVEDTDPGFGQAEILGARVAVDNTAWLAGNRAPGGAAPCDSDLGHLGQIDVAPLVASSSSLVPANPGRCGQDAVNA